jgi:excisionase family DNA binding protein
VVYLSSPEAAKRLGCAQVTVRRAARANRLGIFLQSGRLVAVSLTDLARLRQAIRPTSGNPNWIDAAKRKKRAASK